MAIVWLDLRVNDLERAQEFYRRLLGWRFEPFEDVAVTIYGGSETLGMMSLAAGSGAGPGDTGAVVYLEVKDLEAALQVATSMGARVEFGPEGDGAGSRFVDLLDPVGLRVGLIEQSSAGVDGS